MSNLKRGLRAIVAFVGVLLVFGFVEAKYAWKDLRERPVPT